MNFKKSFVLVALMAFIAVGFSSCEDQAKKDATLKAAIEKVVNLPAGVTLEVNKGVAVIKGMFADDVAKQKVEAALKTIEGLTSFADSAKVKPVVISQDDALTTAVNSVVSQFEGVSAQVNDGVVVLTGSIMKTTLPVLLQSISALNPKSINNQLEVKK